MKQRVTETPAGYSVDVEPGSPAASSGEDSKKPVENTADDTADD